MIHHLIFLNLADKLLEASYITDIIYAKLLIINTSELTKEINP